jgi:aconitate hydratase
MGILPLQFADGQNVESLGLTGKETFDIAELKDGDRTLKVTATPDDGDPIAFEATVRIDTPNEWLYYRNGGILHYVLRQLLAR